jgi:hypothetical protein
MSEETNSNVDKKLRRRRIANETGGCDRCPPHNGENYRLKGRKPKSDKYKNKR